MVFQEPAGDIDQGGHYFLLVEFPTLDRAGERDVGMGTDAPRKYHLLAELKHFGQLLPSGRALSDSDNRTPDEFLR